MFFELQLSADVFTRIVRNRLKALPLCVDREFADTDGKLTGVAGASIVVSQLEISDATSIQRELVQHTSDGLPAFVPGATQVAWILSPNNHTSFTVPFLQVKQEIAIHLVKGADLEANGTIPTEPFRTLRVDAVFNVSLRAANQTRGGGPLMLSYALAYIDFRVLHVFLPAQQRAEIEQFVGGIQLPPTTLNLSSLSSMLKRPVSAINAGIVCDPAGTFVTLRVDFDIYASPVALTPQFFTGQTESFLGDGDWAMLIDAAVIIADAGAKAKKALESEPKVRLRSGPHVSWDPAGPAIEVQAGVELVDACPFFVDDIDMDVQLRIRTQLSVPSTNVVHSHHRLDGSPSDIGEEIACAITGALLWPFIGPLFLKDEDLGEGIGAYVAGLAAGPVLTFIGLIAAMETKKLSQDIADKLGDSCKKVDDENYECTEVMHAAMQLSPPFVSTLDIDRVTATWSGLIFAGTIGNLRDLFMGSLEPIKACPFEWQVLGRCAGNGRSNFRIGSQGSIHVYGTPPAAMCHARILHDPEHEFVLSVDDNIVTITPQFRASYAANPYPCRVRIVTNRGVWTITLAPPVAKTADEAEQLEEARLSAHLGCYYWEKVFTSVEKVKWLPDPPFNNDRFAQFWQIAVRGLQQEESIRVLSARGGSLLAVVPSRAGVAHFALLLAGDEAQPELQLELRGRRSEGREQRELSLQQVLFEHRAALPVTGVQGMWFELRPEGRRLNIQQDDRVVSWDLSTPVVPVLLESVPLQATDTGRAVVVHSGKKIETKPAALLHPVGSLVQRYGEPEVVGSPLVGGARRTLYLRSQSGARLLDMSDGREPREIHVYDRPAWFEGVAMSGNVLAKHDRMNQVVDIYVKSIHRGCV